MDGREFIYLIADITYYSTLSRRKVKDNEIYTRLGLTAAQFSHFKKTETSRIPKEAAKELRDFHKEVIEYYKGLDDPINKIEDPEIHRGEENQNILVQRLEDMQAMLDAERSAKEANQKMVEMMENKFLAMLDKHLEAIEKLNKKLEEKSGKSTMD